MHRALIVMMCMFASVAIVEAATPLERYEALTSRRLAASHDAAVELQRSVETLFSEPNDATLESARFAWRHAHNMFMMAQPLYLGEGKAGHDQTAAAFTTAEEILWGEDDKLDAPGNRPLSDFLANEPEALRRKEQLRASVAAVAPRHARITAQYAWPDALRPFLSELAATATHLARTHIDQPLASRDPRHEPSRYSDNTLEDLRYAIQGMREVVAALEPDSDKRMAELLERAGQTARGIHAHMDYLITAPADHPERRALERIALDLKAVAKEARDAIGPDVPGAH